MNKQLL